MTDDDNSLRYIEIEHAEMNIPVYKKGDSSSVPVDASITPHLVMVMDRLADRSIDCWLEWVDPQTHQCLKQERDRSVIRDFILEKWKASDHLPAKPRRKKRKMDRSSSPPVPPQ